MPYQHRTLGQRARRLAVSAVLYLVLLMMVERLSQALREALGLLPTLIVAATATGAAILGALNRFSPHLVPQRARLVADLIAPSSADLPAGPVERADAPRMPKAPGVAAVGMPTSAAAVAALPGQLGQLIAGRAQATSTIAAILSRSVADEGRRTPLGVFLVAAERGAGASHFVHAVAEVLGQPVVAIDCTTESGIQAGFTEAAQTLAASPGAILVLDAADHLENAAGTLFAAAIRAGEMVSPDGVRGPTKGAVILVVASTHAEELGNIASATPDPVAAVAKATRLFDGMAAGERGRLPHLLVERCDAILRISPPRGEELIRVVLERIEDVAAARGASLAPNEAVDAEVMLELVDQAEQRLEAGVRFDAVVREIDRFAEGALSAAAAVQGPIRIDHTGRAVLAL